MDLFAYRCPMCSAGSPRPVTYKVAQAEQKGHRDRVHGGLAPDGDGISRVTQAATPAWVPLAVCLFFLLLLFVVR